MSNKKSKLFSPSNEDEIKYLDIRSEGDYTYCKCIFCKKDIPILTSLYNKVLIHKFCCDTCNVSMQVVIHSNILFNCEFTRIINDREYRLFINFVNKRMELSEAHNANYASVLLEEPYAPDITPKNIENKIKTWLMFM